MTTAQESKSRRQCVQVIYADGDYRRCRHTATHHLPSRPEVATCWQHARPYDVRDRG